MCSENSIQSEQFSIGLFGGKKILCQIGCKCFVLWTNLSLHRDRSIAVLPITIKKIYRHGVKKRRNLCHENDTKTHKHRHTQKLKQLSVRKIQQKEIVIRSIDTRL